MNIYGSIYWGCLKVSNNRIDVSGLAGAITKTLVDYGEKVDAIVDKQARKSMRKLVARTKKDAPVNMHSEGKHYRDQISSKTLKSKQHKKSYLWYVNGDKYRLAHLLNNGHALRNGGRVPGDKHVTKNAEIAIAEYEKEVKEAIKNGY